MTSEERLSAAEALLEEANAVLGYAADVLLGNDVDIRCEPSLRGMSLAKNEVTHWRRKYARYVYALGHAVPESESECIDEADLPDDYPR